MLRAPIAVALALAASSACLMGEGEPGTGDARRGFTRLAERGCTSCHGSPAVPPEPAPRLETVGARLVPGALEAALSGGPRMPDCLSGLGEAERAAARSELTHYLASLGGPLARPALALDALALERGRQLYHSVGCVACHAPFEGTGTLARPLWDFPEAFEAAPLGADGSRPSAPRDPRELSGIAARTTPEALARYLSDPLAVHPSGRMPSFGLDAGEAADLAAYLLYEDAEDQGARLAPGPGLVLDYFEASFDGETADFDALHPVRSEVATSFFDGVPRREEDFGFRFRGLLDVPEAGLYRFSTTSDDGSMLYLDGRTVVDNRGQHAMAERSGEVHLARGRHAFELTFFEHWGDQGLEVRWSGPGFETRALDFESLSHLEARLAVAPAEPFVLDASLVARGRRRFEALGCASCHGGGGAHARSLEECDPRRGCLAREPRGPVPRYAFAPGEREDLVAAVRAESPPPRTAVERLHDELARLECGACHARGALPGPSDERRSYFQVADGLDLGDEGRLPPSLERAGAKLKPAWFRAVLEEGLRARPYMRTRMPRFGAANVADLPALFAEVDAALRDEREPPFRPEAVEAGRALAGIRGLGCIQCHDFAGHPSIGIPAVDLARVHERLYPGWFRELLMDPVALGMNTRMPSFWVDGRSPVVDVLDGDPLRQVEALWTYLALGSSMPLPQGLVPLPGEYEVEVYDEPVCVGVFMAGVGPRTVCVGLPERVHYAFDVERSRLALAWRGRFLDARGTWHARAGELEKPAGEDVLELPAGPHLASLPGRDDPWPTEVAVTPLGRGVDPRGRPVFRYRSAGAVVTESVTAELRAGGAVLRRRLELEECSLPIDFRAAVGTSIDPAADGALSVRGAREYRLRVGPEPWRAGALVVARPDGGEELRLRAVPAREEKLVLELEYAW
jgi:cytochrome c2